MDGPSFVAGLLTGAALMFALVSSLALHARRERDKRDELVRHMRDDPPHTTAPN